MISLEKAQQLKEAGLEWKPKRGDLYYQHGKIIHHFYDFTCPEDEATGKIPKFIVFAPSLTQLIKEIDEYGSSWKLGTITHDNKKYGFKIWQTNSDIIADTPEDAVALGLLEILERIKI
jgi:hypothetical protein